MPSTLGIVSSHINYIPPTFSIVPNRITLNEGETVTYTISTTNYTFPNIYASNSGTAANADLNFLFSSTIPLVGGTASFTISALKDTAAEGPETLIVNLRTGSTTGPIVATASTVTINDPPPPVYEFAATTRIYTDSSFLVTNGLTKRDGRYYYFALTITAQNNFNVQKLDITVDGVKYIGPSAIRGATGTANTPGIRINSGSTVIANMVGGASGFVDVYRQTDASFAITG
jgi:hypothetical protein